MFAALWISGIWKIRAGRQMLLALIVMPMILSTPSGLAGLARVPIEDVAAWTTMRLHHRSWPTTLSTASLAAFWAVAPQRV